MESLLQKTRRLNKTLQSYGSKPISFSELSKILSRMLNANVYIANTNGMEIYSDIVTQKLLCR